MFNRELLPPLPEGAITREQFVELAAPIVARVRHVCDSIARDNQPRTVAKVIAEGLFNSDIPVNIAYHCQYRQRAWPLLSDTSHRSIPGGTLTVRVQAGGATATASLQMRVMDRHIIDGVIYKSTSEEIAGVTMTIDTMPAAVSSMYVVDGVGPHRDAAGEVYSPVNQARDAVVVADALALIVREAEPLVALSRKVVLRSVDAACYGYQADVPKLAMRLALMEIPHKIGVPERLVRTATSKEVTIAEIDEALTSLGVIQRGNKLSKYSQLRRIPVSAARLNAAIVAMESAMCNAVDVDVEDPGDRERMVSRFNAFLAIRLKEREEEDRRKEAANALALGKRGAIKSRSGAGS